LDSHRVQPAASPEGVTVGGVEFDNNEYDARGDVLYLHAGDPSDAVDFGETEEGDHTRYGPDGSLIGLTILSPRYRLEHEGKIELTLPEHTVLVTDLGDLLK
jgi:uncharacterized protein YuzE